MAGRDIDALVRGIDRAGTDAMRSLALLLTVCLVFMATIVETSHQDIFLNTSKALPQIGTALPLIGIYTVVPVAIAILHLHAVLQVDAVATRVRELCRLIDEEIVPERVAVLDRLSPALLVQWVLAPQRRPPIPALLLSVLVVLMLVVVPLGTLLAAQIRFLPYHDGLVTAIHRLLILLDILVLFAVLGRHVGAPRRARAAAGRDGRAPPRLQPTRPFTVVSGVFAFGVFVFAVFVANLPGGGIERGMVWVSARVGGADLQAQDCRESPWPNLLRVTSLPLAGTSNPPGAAPASRRAICLVHLLTEAPSRFAPYLRRNLVLREATISAGGPSAELIAREEPREAWRIAAAGLDVSGRDLRYADLTGIHLRGVDLRGADLEGAILAHARLKYASLGDIPLHEVGRCPPGVPVSTVDGIDYCGTVLRGADLRDAELLGAELHRTVLAHARLEPRHFIRSWFSDNDLSGVDLSGMPLAGVSLIRPDFTAARLIATDLRAAYVAHAHFADTDMAEAEFDGALMRFARFVLVADEALPERLRELGLRGADLRRSRVVVVSRPWWNANGMRLARDRFDAFWKDECQARDSSATPAALLEHLSLSADAAAERGLQLAGVEVCTPDPDHPAPPPAPYREPGEHELARALGDLACDADDRRVTLGVAKRITGAISRHLAFEADGDEAADQLLEPLRPHEVVVAERLRRDVCRPCSFWRGEEGLLDGLEEVVKLRDDTDVADTEGAWVDGALQDLRDAPVCTREGVAAAE